MELDYFLNTIGLTIIVIFGAVAAIFAIGFTARIILEDRWDK